MTSGPGGAAPEGGGAGSPRALDTTVTFGAVPADPDVDTRSLRLDEIALQALPSGSALLVVLRGPNAGSKFLLDGERTSAGRSPRSDIFLDDVTVSRKHAEFTRDGVAFFVRDVGSLNGTYVQRELVEEVQLRHGDEVQIGKFRMVFYASPHDAGR